MEGPPGLLEPDLLDVLVGALNERLDIRLCAHGTGNNGFIRARQRSGSPLGAENRRPYSCAAQYSFDNPAQGSIIININQ